MIKKILYSAFSRRVFEHVRHYPVVGTYVTRLANSRSMNYIANTKSKLEKISPSMCSAKWLQSTIHLGIGQTHSCHHPVRHFIDQSELKNKPSALHNTPVKINARKEMARGEFTKECEYCWKVERTGSYSDRFFKSAEVWADTDLKELTTMDKIENINPAYLEVSFSSECNLRCAYCDPNISSAIKKEIQKFGPYPTSKSFQNLSEVNESEKYIASASESLTEHFWTWWDDLKKDLKVLRVTGGEPLLSPDLFQLLEKFDSGQLPRLEFSVNSNLMVGEKLVTKFITKSRELMENNKIKSFHLYTSIDTWGNHAEFLRWGLDLKIYTSNIETCLKLFPKLHLTFLVTYQALSPFKFNQFLEFVLDLRKRYPDAMIKVGTSALSYPEFLSLGLLDKKMDSYLDQNLQFMQERRQSKSYPIGFSEFEIERFARIIKTHKSSPYQGQNLKSDFKAFVEEYEKRKGVSFKAVFNDVPEIVSLTETV